MKIAVISIGDELLKGTIENKNLVIIGSELKKIGLIPSLQITVKDSKLDIDKYLNYLDSNFDVIISTGGLGPTEDDITVDTFAKHYELKLCENKNVIIHIQNILKQNYRAISKYNLKQAVVPEKCIIIDNHNGTAPGIFFEYKNQRIFLLPGPPHEMQPMIVNYIIPYIKSNVKYDKTYFNSVYAVNFPESELQKIVSEQVSPPKNINVAYRVDCGVCEITFSSKNKAEAEKYSDKFKCIMGNSLLSDNNSNLFEETVSLLKKNNISLATAESCTAGMIGSSITDLSGVSSIYKGGIIAYSNEVKEHILGVKASVLNKYGAVSKECAEEMVKCICEKFNADAGISVTGIAGPDGGTKEKPVGLVYIAVKLHKSITIKKCNFTGSRNKVRQRTTSRAIGMLRELLIKN
ncbi:MAG: CinA family nicotinamide mononucleotide deamidase-related protein [bacterium]|nr:CinA family nicotinamide mononucleotide deamidase-related protein [bacterium]